MIISLLCCKPVWPNQERRVKNKVQRWKSHRTRRLLIRPPPPRALFLISSAVPSVLQLRRSGSKSQTLLPSTSGYRRKPPTSAPLAFMRSDIQGSLKPQINKVTGINSTFNKIEKFHLITPTSTPPYKQIPSFSLLLAVPEAKRPACSAHSPTPTSHVNSLHGW